MSTDEGNPLLIEAEAPPAGLAGPVARCFGCLAPASDKMSLFVAGLTELMSTPTAKRGILAVTTLFMLVDQYLDGGVAVSLHNDRFKTVALIFVASIVLPQVIAWLFLWHHQMAGFWSLMRILLFPVIGATILISMWLTHDSEPGPLKDIAVFSMVLSVEHLVHLRNGLVLGRETEEAFWCSVTEGLIEAPASGVFTLYIAMLKSAFDVGPLHLHGVDFFILSAVFSLVMVTRTSTRLHFYGMHPSTTEWLTVLVLMKLPQVISQVFGFAIFTFLTRPLPRFSESDMDHDALFIDDVGGKNLSWLVFAVIAQEVGMNFGTLRTVSPGMSSPIAALFATTMVVSSPPGFLLALDGARIGHALQHLVCMILLIAISVHEAYDTHWRVLAEGYRIFVIMYLVSVPWAFIASAFLKREMSLQQRLDSAHARFSAAMEAKDRFLMRLLVDVEGVDVNDHFRRAVLEKDFKTLRQLEELAGVDLREKMDAALLTHDVSTIRLLMDVDQDLVLRRFDMSLSEEDTPVAWTLIEAGVRPTGQIGGAGGYWLDTGRRGKGKWCGICEHAGLLYFCPFNAKEVMVLDPATEVCKFIDTGKDEGGQKWSAVCSHEGFMYFCPYDAAEVMVLDISTGDITFIDTGKGHGGNKWAGVCSMSGRVFFCPYDAPEVMVLVVASRSFDFIDSGRDDHFLAEEGVERIRTDRSHDDVRMMGRSSTIRDSIRKLTSSLSNSPAGPAQVVPPTGTGSATVGEFRNSASRSCQMGSRPAKWAGTCAHADRVYFCPYNDSEVMVLDTATNILTYIDTLKGDGGNKRAKWRGICTHEGHIFFCPNSAADIMVLDTRTEKLDFIDTGKGRAGNKWRGVCVQDGHAYFCPNHAAEVMVLDLSSKGLTFIDTGRGQGGNKWRGACGHAGRVFFCPFDAIEVLSEACGRGRLQRCMDLGLL